jgi:hypothetical protein
MIDYKDLNLSEEELDELTRQLINRKTRAVYEENIRAIDNHKQYVGKCYKEKDLEKYIMIISAKSSNQFRVEAMCFEFPVSFEERKQTSRLAFSSDDAFSSIDFDGIYVEDYPLFCTDHIHKKGNVLNSLEEITKEEYFEKMNEYISQLQEKLTNGDFDTSKNNKSIFKD